MKVTLNLGNIDFDFTSIQDRITSGECRIESPKFDTKCNLSVKDITVTFEASVEETLADIQATTEVFKELKSLASEFGNLFAKNEESRREKSRNDFESVYNMTQDRIQEHKEEIDQKIASMEEDSAKVEKMIEESRASFDKKFEAMQESINLNK